MDCIHNRMKKATTARILYECVAIKGRDGLPRKKDYSGEVMRFTIGPDHSKICDVLPMDNNGGIRIKDY
jgi:hypothetical protein